MADFNLLDMVRMQYNVGEVFAYLTWYDGW